MIQFKTIQFCTGVAQPKSSCLVYSQPGYFWSGQLVQICLYCTDEQTNLDDFFYFNVCDICVWC